MLPCHDKVLCMNTSEMSQRLSVLKQELKSVLALVGFNSSM